MTVPPSFPALERWADGYGQRNPDTINEYSEISQLRSSTQGQKLSDGQGLTRAELL
jgi:hypothetical protein